MKLQAIWVTAAALAFGTAVGAAEDKLGFDTTALPVFRAKCIMCHSGSAPQAGLDLQTAESALKGGKSGPVIQPGAPARSLLIERVVSKSMPPGPDKLTESEIAAIRGWIEKTAPVAPVAVTEADVLPIFQMRCAVCHGKRKQEAGLDLRSLAGRLKGGIPARPWCPASRRKPAAQTHRGGPDAPPSCWLNTSCVLPAPRSGHAPALDRRWRTAGASPSRRGTKERSPVTDKDRACWCFPAVPSGRRFRPWSFTANLVRNPIDHFLLARLEAKS